MVSIVAPKRDGEKHSVTFPNWNRPDLDVTHRLIAKGGAWEICK